MGNSFILKGNICHTPRLGSLEIREHACIVCAEGTCRGIFDNISQIPEQYRALEVIDCGDSLVLPGMVDLHIHAPQYDFRGTGMDYELLKWLDRVTFPEEIRYADTGYAARAYEIFSNGLKKGATTRAVVFGTIHVRSTLILMDCMEKSGLISFVGLIIPNLVRRMETERSRMQVLLCVVWGGALVLFADTLAKTLFYPYELPVGMILSILGAPFFILMIISRKKRIK